MRNSLIIAQKELNTYFASPLAYIITAVFLLVSGFFFSRLVQITGEATLRYWFGNMIVVLLLVSPFLTMRLLAEEQRMGTIELLLTSPVRDWEVVVGKYLGALGFMLFMFALTLFYPLLLSRIGSPDWGPVAGGYLGIILYGAAALAIGVFASSLSQNQIVTAFVSFAILLILYLLNAGITGTQTGVIANVIEYITMGAHFDDFVRGVIDTQHVVYYLIMVVLFLFMATRIVESKRWR